MNTNTVGTRTLAYLRGDKDLFVEREQLGKTRKLFKRPALGHWLCNNTERKVQRFWGVVSLLGGNSRMSLTEMSRRLRVPVSTLFDLLKEAEKFFCFTIVLKDSERSILVRDVPATFEVSYELTTDKEGEKGIPLSLYSWQTKVS